MRAVAVLIVHNTAAREIHGMDNIQIWVIGLNAAIEDRYININPLINAVNVRERKIGNAHPCDAGRIGLRTG